MIVFVKYDKPILLEDGSIESNTISIEPSDYSFLMKYKFFKILEPVRIPEDKP